MKKTVFLMLCASFLCTTLITSCNKEDDIKFGGGETINPPLGFVVLPQNESFIEYKDYVQVAVKNGSISGYPGKGGVDASSNGMVELRNGYFFLNHIYTHSVFTDITFTEYNEIWEKTLNGEIKNIVDTLNTRIIDNDPFKDAYTVPNQDIFLKSTPVVIDDKEYYKVSTNIDKINEMIESGEFFTYEGVERVK